MRSWTWHLARLSPPAVLLGAALGLGALALPELDAATVWLDMPQRERTAYRKALKELAPSLHAIAAEAGDNKTIRNQ